MLTRSTGEPLLLRRRLVRKTIPVWRRAGSGAYPLPIRWRTPLVAILISAEVLKRSLGLNALYS